MKIEVQAETDQVVKMIVFGVYLQGRLYGHLGNILFTERQQ
jgi:hypothetical protein